MSKHTSTTWSKRKRVAVLQRTHFQQTHPAESVQNQLELLVSVQITSQGVTCGFFTAYISSDISKAPRNSSNTSAVPLTTLIYTEFLWSGQVWQLLDVSIHLIYSTKIFGFLFVLFLFSRIQQDEDFCLQIFLSGAGELRWLSCAYKHRVKGQSKRKPSASVRALRLHADKAGQKQTEYNKYLSSTLLHFLFPHTLYPAQALFISCSWGCMGGCSDIASLVWTWG